MELCYRYWAWRADISANELEFIRDLQSWHCYIEYRQDCIDVWVPETHDIFLQLKYPQLQRHPIFDRH